MNNEFANELLRSGIIEAKAGNKETARRYLDRAIYASSAHDALAEGWFWMSQVMDDPPEKRRALENCLSHDLRHARARRALAVLDGKLRPDEIVNPDNLPPAPEGFRKADAQRFICPKCGGRMVFAPDGQSLVCEYCTRSQGLGLNNQRAAEKDFVIAMATSKGHGKPLQEQVFHCQGCGAEFILPPRLISASCMYCGSPHVVSLEKENDLLAPTGIIPHAFDQKRATNILIQWAEGNKLKPRKKVGIPRGLYLPLWTFNVGGAVDYTAEMVRPREDDDIFRQGKATEVVQVSDQFPVMVEDLPIPASRKLSAPLLQLLPSFDLKSAKPYDPRYLADWPAEVYDIPLAEASLDARSRAYSQTRRDLPYLLGCVNVTRTSSANLAVDSFKLVLLPVWMTELPFDGGEHLVLLNGQSGQVASDLPEKKPKKSGGLMEWLGDLLEE
jgi:hypothetical protein